MLIWWDLICKSNKHVIIVKGKGIIFSETCSHCKVKRVVRKHKNLKIKIEKGMKDGQEIVFKWESEQHPDTIPGDLIIKLKQRKHSFFTERVGNDLKGIIELNLKELLLGYDKTKHI